MIMTLRMNLEIDTTGMTLLQLAAFVDLIKHASGVNGRLKCTLPRERTIRMIGGGGGVPGGGSAGGIGTNGQPRDVDISELLTGPAIQ